MKRLIVAIGLLLIVGCKSATDVQPDTRYHFEGDWYGEFEDTKIVFLDVVEKDGQVTDGFGLVAFQSQLIGKFYVTGYVDGKNLHLKLAFEKDTATVEGVYANATWIDCRYWGQLSDRFILTKIEGESK